MIAHWFRGKRYFWFLIKEKQWLGVADSVSHTLHFPKFIRRHVCDAWDRYLGFTDEEMNRKR